MSLRLLTIGFSHYCEKARWALDRAGLDYVESDHVPLLHWAANLRAGVRQRTVPVLLTPHGARASSSEIVRFADGAVAPPLRLFPEATGPGAEVERWVEELDRTLGPATRRVAYHQMLADPGLMRSLLCSTGPAWERRLGRATFPAIRAGIVRGLKITPEGAARSAAKVEAIFTAVGEALADGRRFLVDDRFSAADLTFAALAGPSLVPPQYGFPMPDVAALTPEGQAWTERLRATPAGQFALRLYAEERPPVRAQGRSDQA